MNNEIYIGDNLEVMNSKLFSKYNEKIKMIYIDPPYNTHNSKSYKDKLTSDEWYSFIRDRLIISKKMLLDDGVIFISIDDSEYANLKLLCDEIFGKNNFVGTFITQQSQRSNAKHINIIHEYIVCYAKNKTKLHKFAVNRIDIPEERKMIFSLIETIKNIFDNEGQEIANIKIKKIIKKYCDAYNITWLKNYSNVDENGNIYFAVDLSTPGTPREVNIEKIGLKLSALPTRGWSSDERFIELHKKNRLCFKNGRPYAKNYLYEAKDNVPSILKFYSRQGTNDLKKIGIPDIFDTPKPVDMLKFLLRIAAQNNSLVLDFFAGSGTFAQSVYEVNEEDKKNINYILIQQKEHIDVKSKTYDVCKKNNIIPRIDEVLKYRINHYLKLKGKEIDYKIIEI